MPRPLALAFLVLALAPALDASALRDVLATVRKAHLRGRTPVVVFDLDDTLFLSGSRTKAILLHYARSRRPDLRARLEALDDTRMPYLVGDVLDVAGIRDERVRGELKDYWQARFFSNTWPVVDVPLRGAAAYVQAVHRAGAVVVYLTGRTEAFMGRATREALEGGGFPVPDERCYLLLKNDHRLKDEPFKQGAFRWLETLGEVVASFENEPGNANALLEAFPGATHVLVADRHKPSAPAPDPGLRRIEDFTGARR